ncbi:hypothetical protein GN316_19280 [Xylophilus sp. Kf1]|nr:hypothetical protein [Xylophilus sp. Kf1]
MRSFIRRLDKFVEHTIDWDVIAPPGKALEPMKLKTIFDNLRYYPLLGLLAVVVKALWLDASIVSTIVAVIIGAVCVVLGMLVAMQSSAIYLATVWAAVALLTPRRAAAHARTFLRRSSFALYSLGIVLIAVWCLVGWRLLVHLASRGLA